MPIYHTTVAVAATLLLTGCSQPSPEYCANLVKADEACRADAECWSRQHVYSEVSFYKRDLNRCYGQLGRTP